MKLNQNVIAKNITVLHNVLNKRDKTQNYQDVIVKEEQTMTLKFVNVSENLGLQLVDVKMLTWIIVNQNVIVKRKQTKWINCVFALRIHHPIFVIQDLLLT